MIFRGYKRFDSAMNRIYPLREGKREVNLRVDLKNKTDKPRKSSGSSTSL